MNIDPNCGSYVVCSNIHVATVSIELKNKYMFWANRNPGTLIAYNQYIEIIMYMYLFLIAYPPHTTTPL